jgi:hypothetical protein
MNSAANIVSNVKASYTVAVMGSLEFLLLSRPY